MKLNDYICLIAAETKKEFIYIKHYTLENISRTINLFLLFLVVFFATEYFRGSGNLSLNNGIAAFQLIGYSFWIVAMSCMDVFTVAVREDADIGVLESMALSHYGLISIFMSRTISRLAIDALVVTSVSILVTSIASVDINLTAIPLSICILLITIIGLYGVGLALAGIALLVKRVSSLQALLNYFFLIAGGVFIPVNILPAPLAASIYYLPLSLGIYLVRSILLERKDPNFGIKLIYLIVLSGIYYVIGVYIFKFFEKIAKKKGALASY